MSFVKTISQKETVKITSRFGALELRFKSTSQLVSPVLFGSVRTALNDMNVEILRQTSSGTQTIVQKTKLFDLLSLMSPSVIVGRLDGLNYRVSSMLQLADGSVPFANGDEYHILFDGTYSGWTIDLYQIDFPNTTTVLNFAEKIAIKSGAPVDIIIADAQAINMPLADIQRVEMTFANGGRVVLDETEIAAVTRSASGIIAIDQGLAVTNEEATVISFSTENVYSIKLTTDVDTVITKLVKKQLNS